MSESKGPFWHADTCPDKPTGKLTEQCNCGEREKVEQLMDEYRVTEVVVPDLDGFDAYNGGVIAGLVQGQIPNAEVWLIIGGIAIRQPNGPDVVALAGEPLRIAAGRVERVWAALPWPLRDRG